MLKGYRTLLIAAGVAIVGALQGLNWVNLIPADHSSAAGWIVTGLAVLMGALRSVTTTPVADNGK